MKKILSIDGGGMKGVYAASLLCELEEKNKIRICDYFDLIAGTSTGGIIAAGLAMGIPAKQILGLYMQNGAKIFPPGKHFRFFHGCYNREPLKIALQKVFGDKRIKECNTRLLLPTVNIANDNVSVFKTPHAPDLKYDMDLAVVDCLLATSAAPIYFEPYKMQGGVFIDGGIGANNPSLIALIEGMTRCGWALEEIELLSIGGVEAPELKEGQENLGIINALTIQRCYMMAESRYAEHICKLLLPKGQFFRINQLAGSPKQISLDKADEKSLEQLKSWGYLAAKEHNDDFVKKYFDREKEQCLFFNIGDGL